jgi:hypothetical protein
LTDKLKINHGISNIIHNDKIILRVGHKKDGSDNLYLFNSKKLPLKKQIKFIKKENLADKIETVKLQGKSITFVKFERSDKDINKLANLIEKFAKKLLNINQNELEYGFDDEPFNLKNFEEMMTTVFEEDPQYLLIGREM